MKKVLILLGPTGVGKTGVSLLLAKELDTEIISADSMLIYRHMDIGTAKPSVEERRAVRHHMIDVVEPWENYSTGEYIKDVRPAIDELHRQGRIPLIVGGTGLYIKAMTRGIFTGPSADWDIRNELLKKEEEEKGSLYRRLAAIDPAAASKIMPADTRRIIRALEICLKSERTMTEMHRILTSPLPYEYIKVGLTRERQELYRMVDKRVYVMMEQGLLDEVKKVLQLMEKEGKWQVASGHDADGYSPLASSSMQVIGYKELALHLSGGISLEEAVRLVKQRSRNYAKRQFTWFRKEEGITWIDITGMYKAEEIFQKIKEAIPLS